MDYTQPQFWPQLKQLAQTIDTLDYFQILNLPQTANMAQIRGSYYSMARALHPDKFYHIVDMELRDAVHKIYKRITESYTVLKDDSRRNKYVQDISGPARAEKLRYNEQSEQEAQQQQREKAKVAKTPQGEKMYQAALLDMQHQRWDKAARNIQSALMFEPGNDQLKALKEEIERKRKGG